MGLYQHIRELWKKPKANLGELWRNRLIAWRRDPVTIRIKRPTRLDRARSLGYKPKKGVIIVRQRVSKGGHKRARTRGKKSRRKSPVMTLRKNYQVIAEERASKKYPNCEVLNSYFVAEDGKHHWYEVILFDRASPEVIADKNLRNLAKKKGRAHRGLTSAGRKMRGLRKKGRGAEKIRPSRRARNRRG